MTWGVPRPQSEIRQTVAASRKITARAWWAGARPAHDGVEAVNGMTIFVIIGLAVLGLNALILVGLLVHYVRERSERDEGDDPWESQLYAVWLEAGMSAHEESKAGLHHRGVRSRRV